MVTRDGLDSPRSPIIETSRPDGSVAICCHLQGPSHVLNCPSPKTRSVVSVAVTRLAQVSCRRLSFRVLVRLLLLFSIRKGTRGIGRGACSSAPSVSRTCSSSEPSRANLRARCTLVLVEALLLPPVHAQEPCLENPVRARAHGWLAPQAWSISAVPPPLLSSVPCPEEGRAVT